MRPPFIAALILSLFVLFVLGTAPAHAQDSALFDAPSNSWKLYYPDPETQQWVRTTYVQQNAISPTINSAVQTGRDSMVYRYRVANRRDARQWIDTFRIWGIPLVYSVPNLPPVTVPASDTDRYAKQFWAQLVALEEFEKRTVIAPKGWSGALRVDDQAGQTSFVWTPGLKDTDPDGIPPGRSEEGFSVIRPELPGVARAKLTGATEEPWGLDNLPDTPFWRQKVDEIQAKDYVLVPVLAPVIPVPVPYNGAELARRLRAHVQTWLKYGHISADALARLNRQFDVLVPALEISNQATARAAIASMRRECLDYHPTLREEQVDADKAEHDALPMPRHAARHSASVSPSIDRVAARALMFDLRYIQERLARN